MSQGFGENNCVATLQRKLNDAFRWGRCINKIRRRRKAAFMASRNATESPNTGWNVSQSIKNGCQSAEKPPILEEIGAHGIVRSIAGAKKMTGGSRIRFRQYCILVIQPQSWTDQLNQVGKYG